MFKDSKVKSELLRIAEKEMMELHHPYVGTEHLLLALLTIDETKDILNNYGLNYGIFKNTLVSIVGSASKKCEVTLYTPLLREVITKSKDDYTSVLNALLTSDDGIALRILEIMGIDIDAIISEIKSSDLENYDVVNSDILLIGRDKEINSILEILLKKNKNNPILLGPAGVGKSAVVYELSRRINAGLVPSKLIGYKIINVDLSSMLSNTKYRGEFETKLNNLIKSVKHKKVILFIDEIHTLVKCGGGESSIDAANILKPYLANSEIKIIGATTEREYEEFIASDQALSRRFTNVYIEEPSLEETLTILKGIKKNYEEFHGIKISDEILESIVSLGNKYMKNKYNPDKSIEIMDYLLTRKNLLCSEAFYFNEHNINNTCKLKNIKVSDVEDVVESLTGIHIIKNKEYESLKSELTGYVNQTDIGKYINKRFINFVGKKEVLDKVVNIISSNLKYKVLEIDGMEYTNSTSINRLIGTDPGYVGYNDSNILDSIKYRPYTLLYLSNYDLLSSNIKSLFKTIIDKDYIKDKKNNIISFSNTLIIFHHEKNLNSIGFNNECKDEYLNQVNLSREDSIMI